MRRAAHVREHMHRTGETFHRSCVFSGSPECERRAVFRIQDRERRGRGRTLAVAVASRHGMQRQRGAVRFDCVIIMQAASLLPVADLIGRGCLFDHDICISGRKTLCSRMRFQRQQLNRRTHNAAVNGRIQMLIELCQ